MGYLGQDRQGRRWKGWGAVRTVLAIFVVLLVFMSVVGLWRVGTEARTEMENLAVASAETSQWALSQSEVDALQFRLAIERSFTSEGSDGLPAVRRAFDIFYSRLNILAKGEIFSTLRDQPEIGLAIEDAHSRLDDMIPIIDSADDMLLDSIPELREEADQLLKAVRSIAVGGVDTFSRVSVDRRASVSDVVWDLSIFATLEVGFLLICLFALLALLFQARRAREEIASAEDRLRAVVETAIDAVVVMDRNGLLLDYNGAAQDIFGYARSEAVGRPLTSIILPNPEDGPSAGGEDKGNRPENLLGGEGIVQLRGRSKSGRQFPVEVATATAQSADGEILVSFMRDISERVRAEQELVDARDRALAGEKAKSDLLAVMSHEMRTPINGIMGSLEVLGGTPLTEKQRTFVDAMGASGNMLLRNVNTVLDISRIDAERFELVETDFKPEETVRNVVGSLTGQAASRGNSLSCTVLGAELGVCHGDANRLEQIMMNLIGNAIKFTTDGQISVEIERLPNSDLVEIRVADTGIGIVDEDLERVFSEFVTVDTSFARTVEGSGLGLAIVKRLCTKMRGEVGVESELGEGSVFWVRLPLPEREGAGAGGTEEIGADRHVAALPDSQMQVLLVEDNRINRLVAGEMLRSLQCDVTEAHDGLAAIAVADERPFDVILMDISMPQMTGLEAAAHIRQESTQNAKTPILAMTAHAQPEDIARFLDAGMSEVIVKPVSKQGLAAALARIGRRDPDLSVPRAGPIDAKQELIAALGEEEAVRIIDKATHEISQGLEVLLAERAGAAAPDQSAAIHQMAGLAAVAGLTEARAELIAAQEAARAGRHGRTKEHLISARDVLQAGAD